MNNLPLPRGAAAAKIGDSPPTAPPLVRRAAAPGGRETREARPRIAFSQRPRKMLAVPRLMRPFGQVSDHNG